MAAYEYWRVRIQFTPGVWTDVTSDVDGAVRSTNGATAETTGEPASLSLRLRNVGFKYTPGTSSPTALATGQLIQFYEVILDQYFYHFTGFIEFPEMDTVNVSMTQDQTIAVTAIDQLSAWERSRTFVSTLGAHIVGKGGSALVRYWPCMDAQTRFLNVAGSGGLPSIERQVPGANSAITATAGTAEIQPQTAPAVLADDTQPVRITAATGSDGLGGTIVSSSNDFRAFEATGSPLAIGAGRVVTLVGWYRPEFPSNKAAILLTITDSMGSPQVIVNSDGTLTLSVFGTLTATINGPIIPDQAWVPIAIRYGWDTALIELWVGGSRYTGVLSGAPGGSNNLFGIIAATFYAGCFAHIQLYLGAASAWGLSDYLAQFQMAQTGLEQQTTGQRIKTLAGYAGLTDGQLVNVDAGQSYMQAASLAGKTTAQAMYEARDTEQGDLFVDGAGNLTFHDRRTILNI